MFVKSDLEVVLGRVVSVAREILSSSKKNKNSGGKAQKKMGDWIGLRWDGEDLRIYTSDLVGSISQTIIPEDYSRAPEPFSVHVSIDAAKSAILSDDVSSDAMVRISRTKAGISIRAGRTSTSRAIIDPESIGEMADGALPFDDETYSVLFETHQPETLRDRLLGALIPLNREGIDLSLHGVVATYRVEHGARVRFTGANGPWLYTGVFGSSNVPQEDGQFMIRYGSAKRLTHFLLGEEEPISFQVGKRALRIVSRAGKFVCPVEHVSYDFERLVSESTRGCALARPALVRRKHLAAALKSAQSCLGSGSRIKGSEGSFGRACKISGDIGKEGPELVIEAVGVEGKTRRPISASHALDGEIYILPDTLYDAISKFGSSEVDVQIIPGANQRFIASCDGELIAVAGFMES